MRLADKVVVVTGATKGIRSRDRRDDGRRRRKGVLTGRTVDRGERFAAEIRDGGGEATFMRADIGNGKRDILGLWVGTGGEGAKYWL